MSGLGLLPSVAGQLFLLFCCEHTVLNTELHIAALPKPSKRLSRSFDAFVFWALLDTNCELCRAMLATSQLHERLMRGTYVQEIC